MPRGVYDRSKVKSEANESESPVSEATVDRQIELAYWASVQGSRDPADLEAYLEKYPEGAFVDIAARRIRQILSAEAQGGNPEDYRVEAPKKVSVIVPTIPLPVIGDEIPKYQLLAPFFAEDNTLYPADKEIEYMGPPNEHMFPLNASAKAAKREQEEYLDACWAVKLKVEGKPAIPRPKELADQIEAERILQNNQRGMVYADELPPTRPDLRQGGVATDPRASRIGKVTDGSAFKDRPTNAPLLGREGHRYQKSIDPNAPSAVG